MYRELLLEQCEHGFKSHLGQGYSTAVFLCMCCPVYIQALLWANSPMHGAPPNAQQTIYKIRDCIGL